MVNLLPAVLVGGPPHAGKSVLFYRLTQALRERGVPHHAIRACPDGEGNWFQEGDPDTVSSIRVKLNGEWPASFVERISRDLKHRRLPFLVDMGGDPRPSQESLFRYCTHSILLLRPDKPEYTRRWQSLVEEHKLLPLARLFSQREGSSTITAQLPVLEGTLTGLERHLVEAESGPLFDELVERLTTLFRSYNLDEIQQSYLEQAPAELVLNLNEASTAFTSTSSRWEPDQLRPFLESLPSQTPLAVYGVGPNWLYAALAAYAYPHPLHLFDPKLPFGWVQPVEVKAGEASSSEIHIETYSNTDASILSVTFPTDRLEYLQPEPLALPHLPTDKGLIIYGRLPYWLLTAVVCFYQTIGVPWIAPFYVQLKQAVVVYDSTGTYQPGHLLPMPAPSNWRI
jgi:CRISPR-associated protein Csx3